MAQATWRRCPGPHRNKVASCPGQRPRRGVARNRAASSRDAPRQASRVRHSIGPRRIELAIAANANSTNDFARPAVRLPVEAARSSTLTKQSVRLQSLAVVLQFQSNLLGPRPDVLPWDSPRLCRSRRLADSSPSRKPPRNASELLPIRQPGGKSFNFRALPPPRTT